MRLGLAHGGGFDIYTHYLGARAGHALRVFAGIYSFAGLAVMLSGAGAALREFCGCPRYLGCAAMALFVFAAAAYGLRGLVSALGGAGPLIVLLTIATGILTLCRAPEAVYGASAQSDLPGALFSGALYASYNTVAGVLFFTSLGSGAPSPRAAVRGALIGGIGVTAALCVMNAAFIKNFGAVSPLAIPSLHLARAISPVAGVAFVAALFAGIFTTAAPMAWTLVRLVAPGASTVKRILTSLALVCAAAALSLLPFELLVERVYSIGGYFGLLLPVSMAVGRILSIIKAKRRRDASARRSL